MVVNPPVAARWVAKMWGEANIDACSGREARRRRTLEDQYHSYLCRVDKRRDGQNNPSTCFAAEANLAKRAKRAALLKRLTANAR